MADGVAVVYLYKPRITKKAVKENNQAGGRWRGMRPVPAIR